MHVVSCLSASRGSQSCVLFVALWYQHGRVGRVGPSVRTCCVQGNQLHYVGTVHVESKRGSVGLQTVSQNHAFSQLTGADNAVAFWTERYKKQALLVRGPGSGSEVTAGGVFSDILRLASYLGAPL
jgi:homoserine dehydrogenase